MKTRILGYILVLIALVTLAYIAYRNIEQSQDTLIFAPTQLLGATWADYKNEYLEADTGRTLDKQRDNITTSEGQSYTMLRAVWMGDKETFDQAWQWTKDNLAHEEDNLFAWLFGERPDGTYGVLTAQNGQTSASDGDTDIAVALLFAYARWQDPMYLGDARVIVNDIWEYEVVSVEGIPYLASNNIEKSLGNEWVLINPSYFHPAAYKIFARIDPGHNWNALAQSSYDLLERSSEAKSRCISK
jgi:endo-1,4-beta-D-glucanase Y